MTHSISCENLKPQCLTNVMEVELGINFHEDKGEAHTHPRESLVTQYEEEGK